MTSADMSPLLQQFNLRFAVTALLPIVAPVVAVFLLRSFLNTVLLQWRLRALPLVNGWGPLGFGRAKKLQNFWFNAQGLVQEGFNKSKKAFRIATDNGQVVILSPDVAAEIKNDDRFSWTHFLEEDFLGHVPAFRNFNPKNGLNDMARDVIIGKLTPSLGLVTQELSKEATLVYQEIWTDNTEWHPVNVKEAMVQVIARLSSRVFLGPELCRNPAWLKITADYTMNLFFGVEALKKWPRILHPLVWRFIPKVKIVNDQLTEAERLIKPVVEKRTAELNLERSESSSSSKISKRPKTYTDAIHWANEVALEKRREYNPYLLQLGFSLASIHTTTDGLAQALYDLCEHPEYIEPLREEIATVLREEGMTKAGLFKLQLMDSFVKESQRLKPTMMVQMRRMVIKDVVLSDGTFLPKGVQIGIPTVKHMDPASYPDPDKFDGYRFLRWADDPEREKLRHYVSTSPDHMGFGHGKHACPGRFFAALEMKILLCHILMKYDFKFDETKPKPNVFKMGWAMSSDPFANLMVRRREGEKVKELEALFG